MLNEGTRPPRSADEVVAAETGKWGKTAHWASIRFPSGELAFVNSFPGFGGGLTPEERRNPDTFNTEAGTRRRVKRAADLNVGLYRAGDGCVHVIVNPGPVTHIVLSESGFIDLDGYEEEDETPSLETLEVLSWLARLRELGYRELGSISTPIGQWCCADQATIDSLGLTVEAANRVSLQVAPGTWDIINYFDVPCDTICGELRKRQP